MPYDHTQTGQQGLYIRLLGNFEVTGCRCTLLAGNSSISLAGREEQIIFSQQSPKMLKMASETFIHALLLFLGLFLKISRWVPLSISESLIFLLSHRSRARVRGERRSREELIFHNFTFSLAARGSEERRKTARGLSEVKSKINN